MSRPLQWWCIPGALLVFLGIVLLDATARAPAAAPEALPPLVAVRDASGQRSTMIALGPAAAGALVVQTKGVHKGQRGTMTIWRRVDGRREPEPWLLLRPRVRADATIPIAGLAAGRYDLELVFDDGDGEQRYAVANVVVPGSLALGEAAPGR